MFMRRFFWRGPSRPGGCSCLGLPGSSLWLFFTLMYFFTEDNALPVGKGEFVWRFLAGPINFLF